MNEYLFYAIIFLVMMTAFIATIIVGNSQKNKEGNPSYNQKKGRKMARLSLFYVIAIVGGYLLFFFYLKK